MSKDFPSGLSPKRLRPSVTILIVGVWLVLMGVLAKDRYWPAASVGSDSAKIAAVESDDWFMIRIGGSYSGFGRSRQFRKDQNWALLDELNISLNIQGQIKPILITSEATVDEDFRLLSFSLKVVSGIITFDQKGRIEGRDLVLTIPESQGGGTRKLRLYDRPRISRSLGLPVPLTGLNVGDEFSMPIFDPLEGQKWDAEIKVLEKANLELAGKTVEGWLVRATFRSMQLSMWIDKDGRLLKGRMPMGITVSRSDKKEIAEKMRGVKDLPEMMSLASVPVEGSIPEPRDLKLLRLHIDGVANVPIPSDGFRQEFKNPEITVKRETLPEAGYSLPSKDRRMEEDLASSRFIRSDHPEIIKKAREIVGDEKDPVKAATLINQWVFKYLKKVPTPSVPDAYTTLLAGEGDCNEHAVLAVALARAVGLPARIALGLVYMNDGFYYHAWTEYWSGKTWFTADPLMNELPANPSHVTLLLGDVDKHMNVMTFLGRLKLKVIEAR